MTLGYESLSRKGGQGRIHLLFVSFDFESAFSFRDLLSLHWIGSTLVIGQNQSQIVRLYYVDIYRSFTVITVNT